MNRAEALAQQTTDCLDTRLRRNVREQAVVATIGTRMRAGPGEEDDILNGALGADKAAGLDLFDRIQLAEVLRVCRRSRTISEAGRTLFAVSRQGRKTANDADRLRKYLARFGVEWNRIRETNEECA